MDRREAVLRELNLYPQWVQRKQHVPVVEEAPAHALTAADNQVAGYPNPPPSPLVRGEDNQLTGSSTGSLPDKTTDETTSHLTNPASEKLLAGHPKDAGQVIGYSHSTDETPSHSTRSPKDGDQVAGYRPSIDDSQVAGYNKGGSRGVAGLDWPELKRQVHDCSACKLRAGCTQTVFGVGDENADWLFVGEGPGADEDARGEPFVGQAGQLLDNMLMAIQLKRGKNVYIANVVKCRPPGNRAPEADEIAQCLPYLHRQIELIRPKLIVALGKVASNALLGKDTTLASLRGKLHDYHGIPMIVTYHPAYLLRTPSEKAKAWQDLCLAVKTIAG